MLTNNHSECIVVAQLDNADVIIEYQLKMAYETEQLQLDPKRVQEAVHYLLRSNTNKYGFYLIKIANQQPVGVCLLTYQSVA